MFFTFEYWQSEVAVFRDMIAQDQPDTTHTLLLRGLTYLASQTAQAIPDRKSEVLADFTDCYHLACQIKGKKWVLYNLEVLASHGPVPPLPV
jgi:hypothetical protein